MKPREAVLRILNDSGAYESMEDVADAVIAAVEDEQHCDFDCSWCAGPQPVDLSVLPGQPHARLEAFAAVEGGAPMPTHTLVEDHCPVEGCPCGATTIDEHDTRDAE